MGGGGRVSAKILGSILLLPDRLDIHSHTHSLTYSLTHILTLSNFQTTMVP